MFNSIAYSPPFWFSKAIIPCKCRIIKRYALCWKTVYAIYNFLKIYMRLMAAKNNRRNKRKKLRGCHREKTKNMKTRCKKVQIAKSIKKYASLKKLHWSNQNSIKINRKQRITSVFGQNFGRSEGIRTPDILLPNGPMKAISAKNSFFRPFPPGKPRSSALPSPLFPNAPKR